MKYNILMDMNHLIGPHNGKELELMLSGQKPMAYFVVMDAPYEGEVGNEGFEDYVQNGTFVKIIAKNEHMPYSIYYYCLPCEVWRAKLSSLMMNLRSNNQANDFTAEDLHRIDGYLLGYDKEAIDYFVARWKHRLKTSKTS